MLRYNSVAKVVAFITAFILPSFCLAGDDTVAWKKVGGWQILVDRTIGNSCFLVGSFVGGTVFRIGFDALKDSAYVMVGDDAWTSIEVGKEYDIEIQFDREPPWQVTAEAIDLGHPFLSAYTKQWDFIKEFKKKHSLSIKYKNKEIALLNLKGSSVAVDEMVRCQTVFSKAGKKKSYSKNDPFRSGTPAKSRDPFAY